MADSLEKQIDAMLRNGDSKRSIYTKFDSPEKRNRLIFFLNNKSIISRRHKYMWVNLLLGIVLFGMNIKLLLGIADIISIKGPGFYLIADFFVPTINFYILREMFLFHRTGYQFLVVLTGLALIVYPHNRVMPDFLVNLSMIALGAFLYIKLFPRNEVIKNPKD